MIDQGATIMTIRAVFFDVGETLIDETRSWARWADWLQVSHLAFFAALGATIERNQHHRRVFEIFRPGFDHKHEQEARVQAGAAYEFTQDDLYPDVRHCLATLRAEGYVIGLAGNQPARAEELLAGFGLPVDVIASSARWGIDKPDPAFFARIVSASGVRADEIAYVGDRLDNDVLPATAAGMLAVFLRRGPWGYIHASRPEAERAHTHIDSLDQLPDVVRRHSADT
jgi:HAD superfamily hydrolase (TIGR01549 family)